tara:strand:- start:1395 stop:2948 length:1554 start_codon:yes stop_codon:yes gene_type:complete
MNLSKEINKIIFLLNNQEYKKAKKNCEKLIKLKVQNSTIYNLQGIIYQKIGHTENSIQAFEKSLEIENENYIVLNNLATSLVSISKYKYADKIYQKCLNIKPDYVFALNNYAKLKEKINKIDQAIILYKKILKLNSYNERTLIYLKIGKLYYSLGNFDQAAEYALKVLKDDDSNIEAFILISSILEPQKNKKLVAKFEKIYENKNLKDKEVVDLSFSLGKHYDSLKNYKKAFFYFNRGNSIKNKKIKYNNLGFITLSESILKFFKVSEIYKIKKNISDKKIIFICGMPRSGTTLIEQIISSHHKVFPTGENNFLSLFIKQNYLKEFSLNFEEINKDILSKKNRLNDFILNSFDEHDYQSEVFTDKSVQNFLWIGFIKIFFPNSKIIITDRDSKDVCLSIFKINFDTGFMNFAYEQKDIADFYNTYHELITFWKNIFPQDIYSVKYEKLVEEPKVEIKKLIKFCELEWDVNCLNHHTNKSVIKTASINQARKRIYKSSQNSSRNYSNYLEQMFSLLKN